MFDIAFTARGGRFRRVGHPSRGMGSRRYGFSPRYRSFPFYFYFAFLTSVIMTQYAGDDKVILMTSTFDVLSELPLHPSEFGEGQSAGLHCNNGFYVDDASFSN